MLLVTLSLLLLSAAQARAEEGPLEEVGAGQLLLTAATGEVQMALSQHSRVDMDISGMIAVVRLQQVFRNETPHWVEGVYAYPLPDTSAVRHMALQVGERRIVGRISEKEKARAAYKEARKAGKKTSLVEQQRPNLFTNRVANIAPGETVTVELEYVQPVRYSDGSFALRLPATITPRYLPGVPMERGSSETMDLLPSHGWAVATSEVADAAAISPLQHAAAGSDLAPRNPLELHVRLDAGLPLAEVTSPYHQIVLTRRDNSYTVRLANGKAEMDRDFELNWRPVTGSVPAAALFTEQVDGEYYGLLMVVPPSPQKSPEAPPRELVFVVDTSGSMGGVSIRQARDSVSRSLRFLRPEDQFNIIAFNSGFRTLFRQARAASPHNLQLAQEFVRHLQASGGTEMLPALRAALAPSGVADELAARPPLRQVIFITDGAVGNEDALFAEIEQRLGATRLFTVGIGSAPNGWFMRKAADYGRGSHTLISDVGEVDAKMSALFRQLASPVAVDMAVAWPAPVEVWPARVPDLYLGEPLLLAVKFGEQLPDQPLQVTGRIAGAEWQTTLRWPGAAAPDATAPDAPAPDTSATHPGVASLWARKKIEHLLGEARHGEDQQAIRDSVLPIALRHQLLSPYTSFVAVEEVVSRPSTAGLKSLAVPNTRPQRQAPQAYAYPGTATTATARIWLASLLLMLAVLVYACRAECEYA